MLNILCVRQDSRDSYKTLEVELPFFYCDIFGCVHFKCSFAMKQKMVSSTIKKYGFILLWPLLSNIIY